MTPGEHLGNSGQIHFSFAPPMVQRNYVMSMSFR
jgi:hypothetical protein